MPGIDVFSDGFSDGHPHRGFFDATQWQWESQQWDNTMLSPCYYLESHSKRCCVPIYYLENWKSSSILAKCLVPIGTLALSKVAEILVTGKCAILGLRYFYGYLRRFTDIYGTFTLMFGAKDEAPYFWSENCKVPQTCATRPK